MNLTISGKHVEVGDALKVHIEKELSNVISKYFDNAVEARVVISKETFEFQTHLSVHIGRGLFLHSSGEDQDPYRSVDIAVDKLSKRLRRQKNRLRYHHAPKVSEEFVKFLAQQYVISSEEGPEEGAREDDTGKEPAVIAEIATEIATLSVSEAILKLDFEELPAMLFVNRAHGGINMVYRRVDGNIGWVDPNIKL